MSDYAALKIKDFDHIEFAVNDLDLAANLYLKLGFEKIGTREILERQLRSYLMVQDQISILLSHSTLASDPVSKFLALHGDGVISVAFRCEDALSAFEIALSRGAEKAEAPRSIKKNFGEVHQASIKAFGDVRHTFISREGSLFAEGFEEPFHSKSVGFGLSRIDHITTNVEAGKLNEWVQFYEKIMGLQNTRFFDIHTKRTGLYSKVMQSPDGVIKMPVNEPVGEGSQIQEFIDIAHGAGVQHVALASKEIIPTLRQLRREAIPFLDSPPQTYYEAIPGRIPNVSENMSELAELGIMIDGSTKGYLLQIFTQTVAGPFFYEVIQRKGDDGFGEGNFTALFEAIERDQIRRGVLR